jgi:hypothetical protein
VVQQIEIDDDVFGALKSLAEPFVDTPNSVLRRVLGLDGAPTSTPADPPVVQAPAALKVQSVRRRKRSSPPAKPRAAAGTLLPEQQYEAPLLRALAEAGGRAPYREVVEAVGKQLDHEFTELDKDTLRSGGVRWQSRLQFVRLRLVERGLLDRETPRGIWGLTEAGRKAAENGGAQ